MQGSRNLWLVLAITLTSGCTDDEEWPLPPPLECPEGTESVGSTPPTGNRQFCINGETKLEEGPWRFYFPNGRLQREGFYHAGRKHGAFKKWNTAGIITSES